MKYKSILNILFISRILSVRAILMQKSNVRIELFFKTHSDLRERVQFLSTRGVRSFNLVNKSNKDNALEWVDVIREEIPDASICAHYSAKYNKSRMKDGALKLFVDFVEKIDSKEGDNEVLVVTGSGDKGKFNSVTAMETIAEKRKDTSSELSNGATIAVAYNPFFPDQKLEEQEQKRLMEKIDSNQVDRIYLQFGTDLELLRASLEWLTKLRPEKGNFDICGSIFLPTKKLIAQQRFRPWNGVFLSEEFLNSEDGARGIVLEMMRLYQSFGCEILIEAPGIRNEKDMKILEDLLQDRDSESIAKASVGEVLERSAENSEDSSKRRKIIPLPSSNVVSTEDCKNPAILLFGTHDVRLHDNEAFQLSSFHQSVIPLFLWCNEGKGKWGINGASEVVLKNALRNLQKDLQASGLKLITRSTDDFQTELHKLCLETNASAVYWNKEHTTEGRIQEKRNKHILHDIGVKAIECQSSLLYDPSSPALSISSGFNGGHWGTLMPFLRTCRKQLGEPRRPILRHETFAILKKMSPPLVWPESSTIDDLGIAIIEGKDDWDTPILKKFPMSESDALQDLNDFFSHGFHLYERDRSRADIDHSTSKLSAHLRIGTLSPNEFFYRIEDSNLSYEDRKTISRRLIWRDLAYYQLYSFPNMCEESIRQHYSQTEWVSGEEERERLDAWKKGRTGYPLVDAGMRELWATGWMTQSVRMVVASFLTEYLRVNWVKGCEWFHYTLVDADPAINSMMWQNAGRSGIDQWNFVMSPTAASQDASGNYTRIWVPELSGLKKPLLHSPWKAPTEVLHQAGVELGKNYPHRIIVDLEGERRRMVDNVLKMRHRNQSANDDKGYDLITLPNGKETVVFTKKEFRIDRCGNVMKAPPRKKKGRTKSGRGRNRI